MLFSVVLDDVKHELDLDKMLFSEARAIQKVTGMTLPEAVDAFNHGDVDVVQALVWVTVKRSQPTLTFSDLDSRAIGDAKIDIQPDEVSDETDPTQAADAAATSESA